jgi:hypothetical protein
MGVIKAGMLPWMERKSVVMSGVSEQKKPILTIADHFAELAYGGISPGRLG